MALTEKVAMGQVQNDSFVSISVTKEKEVWVRTEDWKSKGGHYLLCNFLRVKWILVVYNSLRHRIAAPLLVKKDEKKILSL